MRSLIEPGDIITNRQGHKLTVTEVTKGTPGILIKGVFPRGLTFRVYVIPELTPTDPIFPWYNWPIKDLIILSSGRKLSGLALYIADLRPRTIELYDSSWKETVELIHQEELKLTQLTEATNTPVVQED